MHQIQQTCRQFWSIGSKKIDNSLLYCSNYTSRYSKIEDKITFIPKRTKIAIASCYGTCVLRCSSVVWPIKHQGIFGSQIVQIQISSPLKFNRDTFLAPQSDLNVAAMFSSACGLRCLYQYLFKYIVRLHTEWLISGL